LERFLFLANMDISAHTILLADRPQEAIRVTSFRMRREDRSSISFYPLADLGGEGLVYLISRPFFGAARLCGVCIGGGDSPCFEVSTTRQNAPSDAGKLVGESDCKQPGVVAKALELAAEMMCANAGFHSDKAWWHIRKSGFNLRTRPFLPQNNRAPLSRPTTWKKFLPISMPITAI